MFKNERLIMKKLPNDTKIYEKYALKVVPLILKMEGAVSEEYYDSMFEPLIRDHAWVQLYALVLGCRTALVTHNKPGEEIRASSSMRVEIPTDMSGSICKSIW